MSRNALLKTSRLVHLYFGVFITPALMFFAISGALQTFGLHETNRDHPNYKPAHWLVVMGQIHKKQTTIIQVRKPQPAADARPAAAAPDAPKSDHPHREGGQPSDALPQIQSRPRSDAPTSTTSPDASKPAPGPISPAAPKPRPLPMRIFFLIISVGLFTSTVTGLHMSYKYIRNKLLVTATLIAGIIIPVALAFI